MLRTLRAEKVGTAYVRAVPEADTGLLIREPAVCGPTDVLYRRHGSAGALMDATYVEECAGVLAGASMLHVTGITPALSSSCAEAIGWAIDLARSNGLLVSLDVNMRSKLWTADRAQATLRDLAPRCDLVLGDEAELALLTGTSSTVDAIAHLHHLGVDEVVVKRGTLGAVVHSPTSAAVELPGVPVSAIRDLIGAGDAFVAGYLTALLDFHGDEQAGAVRPDHGRGSLVAAFTLRAVDDSTRAPTRAQINDTTQDILR